MTRSILLAATVYCAVAAPNFALAQIDVSLTRVGDPIWKPSEVHVFSAPAATDEEFFAVLDSIREPCCDPSSKPPWDTVVGDGMAAAGYVDQSLYPTTAINGQNGSYFTFTLVPDPGVTGSSFFFDSGPIIPASLLPLQSDIALRREGIVINDGFFGQGLWGPPPVRNGFDGVAFIHPFAETDANFFPLGTPLTGNWEWSAILRDSNGSGWDIAVPFQVVPEPSCIVLLLLVSATAGTCILRRWRSSAVA